MKAIQWDMVTASLILSVLMLVIGFYFAKKVKTGADFWIGGRNLGPWVVGFSFMATYWSPVFLVGAAGNTYVQGFGWGMWQGLGTALCVFGGFLLFSKRIRLMCERLGVVSLPEFFRERYGSQAVQVFSATLIIIMMVPFLGSVLQGLGSAYHAMAGIPYTWAILGSALVIAIYTMASGFYGVCWTDLFQGIVLMTGAVLLFPFMMKAIGGFSAGMHALRSIDPALVSIPVPSKFSLGMFITLSLVWGPIGLSQPDLLARFYAIRKPSQLKTAFLLCAIIVASCQFSVYGSAALGRSLFPDQFVKTPDLAMPSIISAVMPHYFAVIFMAAVLAAAMSTVDSVAILVATAVVRDWWEDYLSKGRETSLSESRILSVARITSFTVVALGVLVALWRPAIVFTLAVFSRGVLAAAFGPVIFYSLYWKRGNKESCLWSMAIGAVVCLLAYYFKFKAIHPYMTGMVASAVAYPIIAKFTPTPPDDLIARSFGESPSTAAKVS